MNKFQPYPVVRINKILMYFALCVLKSKVSCYAVKIDAYQYTFVSFSKLIMQNTVLGHDFPITIFNHHNNQDDGVLQILNQTVLETELNCHPAGSDT